jgi:hypothetical protein
MGAHLPQEEIDIVVESVKQALAEVLEQAA